MSISGSIVIACARCTLGNAASSRFCVQCGLPLGAGLADAGAVADAIDPYEAPEPADPDISRLIGEFVAKSGFEVAPSGRGWRMVVPARLDRKQAVYAGPAGVDPEGRAILGLVSVCGPANERDCRILLKLNARVVGGRFAIRVLRGEEYFVVVENLPVESVGAIDPQVVVRGIAAMADSLEDRLSRGRDLY
jgi:hypothetical protein